MLSIRRMDRLLEKMSRGEAWSFPATIPRDDDTISVYSVDVASRGVDSNEMTSLIPSSGILFNLCETAPPPCKDYCQIVVTLNEVTFRLWKISLRNNIKVAPIEMKNSYEDFPFDERARSEILRVFGRKTYDYVVNLCHGQIDYLPRLPRNLLIKIVEQLDLEDIAKLSVVSKQFQEICNSDELWEQLYLKNTESATVTEQLYALARELGWKKLFFTNKLQLQVQLRRQAQRMQEQYKPLEHGDASLVNRDHEVPEPHTSSEQSKVELEKKAASDKLEKMAEAEKMATSEKIAASENIALPSESEPNTSQPPLNSETKSTPFLTEDTV